VQSPAVRRKESFESCFLLIRGVHVQSVCRRPGPEIRTRVDFAKA
jgi:hypothetical protein